MKARQNSQEKSIYYFTPEDETEIAIIKEAWVRGVLKLRVTSFNGGDLSLGVSFKTPKQYAEEESR